MKIQECQKRKNRLFKNNLLVLLAVKLQIVKK